MEIRGKKMMKTNKAEYGDQEDLYRCNMEGGGAWKEWGGGGGGR